MTLRTTRLVKKTLQLVSDGHDGPMFLVTQCEIGDLCYINGFLSHMRNQGQDLRGVILDVDAVGREDGSQRASLIDIERDKFYLVRAGRRARGVSGVAAKALVTASAIRILRKLPLANQNIDSFSLADPLYVVIPWCGYVAKDHISMAFSLNRPVVYVTIDDGLAFYSADNHARSLLSCEREKSALKRILMLAKIIALRPINDYIQAEYEKKAHVCRYTMFRRTPDGLKKDIAVCSGLITAFAKIAKKQGSPQIDYTNTVIIATVKSEALHLEDVETAVLRRVIVALKDAGLKVILRPHPSTVDRGRYEQLGVEIDHNADVPIESLLSICINKPCAIVGFVSSSLLLANLLWDIPSASIVPLIQEELKSASKSNPAAMRLLKYFVVACELFSEYVDFPADEESLLESLGGEVPAR